MAVDDVAHYGIEYGVAQKFQTLVVERFSLGVAPGYALVHQGQFVVLDVAGIEADDVVEGRKKLLLLAETELYSIYDDIIQHIS